jgi:hypothetical protein
MVISKSHSPHRIAYLYGRRVPVVQCTNSNFNIPKPHWKLDGPIDAGNRPIKDTIPFIDRFTIDLDYQKLDTLRPIMFSSVVVTVDLQHHDVRYKQYLYDLSLSIRDQIGIEFIAPPTIPHFEDNFTVGFSLISNDELIDLSNDIIGTLEKMDSEKELDQKRIDQINQIKDQQAYEEKILLMNRSQMSFTNPFQDASINQEITIPSGDSNGSLLSNKKKGFFKWLFSSASSGRSW